MPSFPATFHFIHPLWLWALAALPVLLWLLHNARASDRAWRGVVDARLLPHLLVNPGHSGRRWVLGLLGAGGVLAILALANPTWERQPQPVYRSESARVVVLDLSNSMLAGDVTPSRLARARLKIADILQRNADGQTGLVVYAGDAFTVAPLTTDMDTIKSLLAPLAPGLMPVQGSRADLGLHRAADLLTQAGLAHGDIVLITDGVAGESAQAAARAAREQGYRVSILGIGTAKGAPVPNGRGGFIRDDNNKIVVPTLDSAALKALAHAGGGRYAKFNRSSQQDIEALLPAHTSRAMAGTHATDLKTDQWQSRGPWLLLVLLPLAALAFRRGWLMVLVVVVNAGLFTPQPVQAATWDDLWQRPDQQAEQALHAGALERAEKIARDPLRRGSAAYRAKNYQQALKYFDKEQGSDAAYNRGNTLAKLGRYKDAIAAYDQALGAQPGMPDAKHNRAEVEKLLEQQKQKQQRDSSNQSDKDSGKQKQSDAKDKPSEQRNSYKSDKSDKSDKNKPGKSNADKDAQSSQSGGKGDQQQKQKAADQAAKNQPGSGDQAKQAQKNKSSGSQADNDNPAGKNPQTAKSGPEPQQPQDSGQNESSQAQQSAAKKSQSPSAQDNSTAQPGQQADARAGADSQAGSKQADPLNREQRQAAEQWLRRIPDDPGGLLRRKFLYQYRQRSAQQAQGNAARQAW